MDKATDVIDAALEIDKSAVKNDSGGYYDADLGTFVEGAAPGSAVANGELVADEVPDVLGLNTLLSPQRLAAKFKKQPVVDVETKPVAPTPSQHSDAVVALPATDSLADHAQKAITPDADSQAGQDELDHAAPAVVGEVSELPQDVADKATPAPDTTELNASVSDSDSTDAQPSGRPHMCDEPEPQAADEENDAGSGQAAASVQERDTEAMVTAQEISSPEQSSSAKVLIDTQEMLSAVRAGTPPVVREVREAATADAVLEQREQQLIHLSDGYGKLQQENEKLAAHIQLLVGELETVNAREKVSAWPPWLLS